MAIKFLKADQLPAFLGCLAEKARVVAPVKTDGVVQFQPWAPGKDVELDVLLAKQSPKEYVFLQTETYLKFGYADGGARATAPKAAAGEAGASRTRRSTVEALNEAPAQVIFGLRPCDARGFVQMDQVFGGYGGFYFDPLYNARREATTLLAVTCRDPRSTCFCTAIGGCPAGHEGVDALFTQVDGGFTVEALTEKGEAAAGGVRRRSPTPPTPRPREAAEVKMQATTEVDVPFALEGIRDNLHDNIAQPGLARPGHALHLLRHLHLRVPQLLLLQHQRLSWWRRSGERYRCWDNCFNPLYTEETSGHNPRAQKSNRFRNRFSHKFWYYPDKYDSLLCSGCGRCIMHCPTRIDIREVLRVMGSPGAAGAAPPWRRRRVAAPPRPPGRAGAPSRRPTGRRRRWLRQRQDPPHRGRRGPRRQHRPRGQAGRQPLPPRGRDRRQDHPGDPQHQDLPHALRRPGGAGELLLPARPGGPVRHLRRGRVDLRHHLQAVARRSSSSSRS